MADISYKLHATVSPLILSNTDLKCRHGKTKELHYVKYNLEDVILIALLVGVKCQSKGLHIVNRP